MTNISYPYAQADNAEAGKSSGDRHVTKQELLSFIAEKSPLDTLVVWREECKHQESAPNLNSFIQNVREQSTISDLAKQVKLKQNLVILDAKDITAEEVCNSLPLQLRPAPDRTAERLSRNFSSQF